MPAAAFVVEPAPRSYSLKPHQEEWMATQLWRIRVQQLQEKH
jgi:predicted metallo-beta-lactamase superfamily hydrolase